MANSTYRKMKKRSPVCEHDELDVVNALTEAFRGGNVHANRLYVSELHDFTAFDKSAHYVNIMIHERFPITPFQKEGYTTNEELEYMIAKRDYECLFRLKIRNLKLKNPLEPVPYISKSKCRNIIGCGPMREINKKGEIRYIQDPRIGEIDNGRLCYCMYFEATFLSLDFEIVKRQYDFDYEIVDLWTSELGYLPPEFRRYLVQCYRHKTMYKNVKGKETEYNLAKIDGNACYGLFVQSFITDSYEFDEYTGEVSTICNSDLSYYDKKYMYEEACQKRPTPYRLGVACACLARYELQEGIDVMGADWAYGDTDSTFGIGDFTAEFDELNKKYIERALKSGAYATDPDGVVHYCGSWELDKEGDIVTMGSKKYAVKKKDGTVVITVAGCPKGPCSIELQEAGGLSAFKEGMVFHGGKLRPIYNMEVPDEEFELYDYRGNTGKVKLRPNVCLVDTEYKLSYGDEYGKLIKAIKSGDEQALDDLLASTELDATKYSYYLHKLHGC